MIQVTSGKVLVYDYSCHLTMGNLADKMGSCLFIRRSAKRILLSDCALAHDGYLQSLVGVLESPTETSQCQHAENGNQNLQDPGADQIGHGHEGFDT